MCAFGSDFFVSPSYGLSGIQVAMTRKCVKMDAAYELYKDVPAANPKECDSLKEALQAHTINGAYQAHLEDVTGSIEVGKSAELTVLDQDLGHTPAESIEDINVVETVFKGKTVFKSA
jgi:predicted amidohydrolase YtcJ